MINTFCSSSAQIIGLASSSLSLFFPLSIFRKHTSTSQCTADKEFRRSNVEDVRYSSNWCWIEVWRQKRSRRVPYKRSVRREKRARQRVLQDDKRL